MKTSTLIQIRDLSIGYGGKELYSGISLDICKGDCILLCGANGSGKSTLLRTLAGMIADAAMIPTRIPRVKGFTLNEFISLSCHRYPQADPQAALARLALEDIADRDISTLSDGEFQKGTIASAIARKAGIILLDEPTAFLDAQNRRDILLTLRNLCDETGTAVIFSSHDLHESGGICNKVIALGADGLCRCSEENIGNTISSIFAKD